MPLLSSRHCQKKLSESTFSSLELQGAPGDVFPPGDVLPPGGDLLPPVGAAGVWGEVG